MVQGVFFFLFIISIIVGGYVYLNPGQKSLDPLNMMMKNSGYSTVDVTNSKRMQELNISMDAGLVKIRRKMDELAVQQSEFLEAIQDQQQILNNTGKEITSTIDRLGAKEGVDNKDILRLKELGLQLKDQQRLLVSRGQDLIILNDQLIRNRRLIAEQADLVNSNTKSTMQDLSQRYSNLQNLAQGVYNRGTGPRPQAQYQMFKTPDQPINDSQERTQELIDEERRRAQEQEDILQERIADERQRAQEQQNQ